LKVADAYEVDGLTVEDFYDWVFAGCISTFAGVTPPALPAIPTLADYLNPAARSYSLHANDHYELELVETSNEPRKRVIPGTRIHEDLACSWPSFILTSSHMRRQFDRSSSTRSS
jgi:hypothetical protein